jgi:hypothetical protein
MTLVPDGDRGPPRSISEPGPLADPVDPADAVFRLLVLPLAVSLRVESSASSDSGLGFEESTDFFFFTAAEKSNTNGTYTNAMSKCSSAINQFQDFELRLKNTDLSLTWLSAVRFHPCPSHWSAMKLQMKFSSSTLWSQMTRVQAQQHPVSKIDDEIVARACHHHPYHPGNDETHQA